MDDSGTTCMGLFEPGQPLLFYLGWKGVSPRGSEGISTFAGGEDRADSPSEPALVWVSGTVNGISGLACLPWGTLVWSLYAHSPVWLNPGQPG